MDETGAAEEECLLPRVQFYVDDRKEGATGLREPVQRHWLNLMEKKSNRLHPPQKFVFLLVHFLLYLFTFPFIT